MSLAVVDASTLTAFYSLDDPRRAAIVERLAVGDAMYAPAHLDVEIASSLRGLARVRPDLARQVPAALTHLADLPVRRMPLSPLLLRIWELRHNLTPCDAAYVALAERLDAALITCDRRMAAATGPRCRIEVVG